MRKIDENGFTLVELIVVIAILAIIATFSFYTINMITGAKGRDCADKIENVFNKTRIASQTMAGDHTVSIYYGENNEVIIDSSDEGIITAGKHGVRVTYQLAEDSEETELGQYDQKITFTFTQNSGSFSGTTYDNVKVYANNHYWMIKFYKLTGKTEVTKHFIDE